MIFPGCKQDLPAVPSGTFDKRNLRLSMSSLHRAAPVNVVEIQQCQEHGPSQEEEEDEPAQGQEGKGTEEVLLRGCPIHPR